MVTEKTKLKRKCLKLAKDVAKMRDEYTCQRCGKSGNVQIHGSHVYAVSRDARLAVDPVNIKALCAQCHMWWHEHPIESGLWFRDRWPDRIEYLDAKLLINKTLGTVPISFYRERFEDLQIEFTQGRFE